MNTNKVSKNIRNLFITIAMLSIVLSQLACGLTKNLTLEGAGQGANCALYGQTCPKK